MNTQIATVYVVEDDVDLANLVCMHLRDLQLQVTHFTNGDLAYRQTKDVPCDVLVLDITLPGMDGLEICRQLRQDGHSMGILMLTSRDAEIDRVLGLELGADDYLTKPFSVRELQARVKALLRRSHQYQSSIPSSASENCLINIAGLEIDPGRHQVRRHGDLIDLTAKEFELLLYLAKRPQQVFSRNQLLDAVWGYSHSGYEHTVNSHINRLRNKIEQDPSQPQYVQTVWGVGYKFGL
tara:strand:- start:174 stop:887 length:714 start_codon:yes stop_codon:yes gene_type:complete